MSKRLADDCGEIVSSKRQQNESSGSDEAAIRDHIKFLVGNVQLCYDGADILHRDRYDLGKLFETRFGLPKEVAAAVKKETDSAVEYYSSALADKYKNLPSREPEPCSPSNSNEDNSKQVDDFEEYVHTVRKVGKNIFFVFSTSDLLLTKLYYIFSLLFFGYMSIFSKFKLGQ